ncbi:hypothetical protein JVT61DRAFT_3677 [Boletus reticuloceps]|uniref:Uncharacterized protein n=1 Tax=Boletus reticuloceps TaxID=495285 RepID=A0A8I3A9W1_9AGAM|nr:hypothetical protein JVT61DRAFT_3677 [Boletus reticuloceps]
MSILYKDEITRVDVLKSHGILLKFSSQILNSRYVVDGDMSVGKYRYVIAEFKNEVGSAPAQPFLEAIVYYVESTRELALENPRSPLSCLLLVIYGVCAIYQSIALIK